MTEEQRKERLRIVLGTKWKEDIKRSTKTEDHKKQRLATIKRLKRGDVNELERKLRLEKVVAGKHLRLDVDTEEERILEKILASTQLRLALKTEEERRAKKGFDLIWIKFGLRFEFSKTKNFQGMSSLAL